MAERTIILHYHLFKNAGTSLDRILQQNFSGRWVTAEFPPRSNNNTPLVEQWICDNPDAVAFSSHTMLGPIPEVPGVRIVSLMLLRDPIDRIWSAYRFERLQKTANFGAVLARHTDFEGYVRVRLALPGDRQCRNFQTARLASLVPGEAAELERARDALGQLAVVGRVEEFDAALTRLKLAVADDFPDFDAAAVHTNRSRRVAEPENTDLALETLLREANIEDLELLEHIAP